MTREDAINKLKHLCSPEQMTALKVLVPELQESEDEMIRRNLIDVFNSDYVGYTSIGRFEKHKIFAWLEKQKASADYANEEYWRGYREGKQEVLDKYAELEKQKEPKEELFVRINGLINEYIKAGADEAEQEHRLKCYHLFLDSLEDAKYFEQKEQKPLSTEETELNSIAFLEQLGYTCIPSRAERKPIITGEDVAWIDELKQDLEHPEELDRKVQEALKKRQKPVEKQDYSGLNALERAILRGFLCAGVDNVPVTIIKETVQDCLAQIKPAEWSEKDKEELKYTVSVFERCGFSDSANWLKSLPNRFSLKRTNVTVDSKLTYDENGEPELTPFESALFSAFSDAWQEYMCGETVNVAHWAKEHSEELLEVAKEDSAEWSEEDDACYETIKVILEDNLTEEDKPEYVLSWFKSQYLRPHWKPSDRQLGALLTAFGDEKKAGSDVATELRSLYYDLKKL